MLNDTTKRKINSLRDILVGVVPGPEAQVNQITNALIYKYMDDMDQQAIVYGGKSSFFVKEYEKYSWKNLMDPKKGGQERMNLYVEALEKMGTNKNLSPIFRDILKSAFLPYRSPETLNLFLSEVDGFSYDHSEELGNAFEYLLAIMGSQGDAGMFRTPRHIIDFIVKVVDPKKDETVLDPACGTAGFLISAYKHIIGNHDGVDNETGKATKKEVRLSADEIKKIHGNFCGYDINPDMTKFSRVNMFLHNFPDPKIFDYDTLSSDERWDDNFDVILANPPFMTPKGGIIPHKRFSVPANRAEVLFVDYIMNHLRPKGRAGIIVPEGILFKSETACKQLRKNLIEDGLFAVVSLPVGIFNPYSATIKTSVLFFDNTRSKSVDEILFVNVDADGYDLGARRQKISVDDLPEAAEILRKWQYHTKLISSRAVWVKKIDIVNNKEYSLKINSYKEAKKKNISNWKTVKLVDICNIKTGRKNVNQGNPNGKYPFFTCAQKHTFSDEYSFDTESILIAGNGDVGTVTYYKGKFEAYQRTYVLTDFVSVVPRYLFFVLKNLLKDVVVDQKLGNTMGYIKLGAIQNFELSLPSISAQNEILKKIEKKEKEISSAKELIERYRKEIKADIGAI